MTTPTSVGTKTGRGGEFRVDGNVVARCQLWVLTNKLDTYDSWGDSDGDGFTNYAEGRHTFLFRVEGKYEETHEVWDIFEPGDVCEVRLLAGQETLVWFFRRALCLDFEVMINFDTEEVIGWKSSWAVDGEFFRRRRTVAAVPIPYVEQGHVWTDGDPAEFDPCIPWYWLEESET